MKVEYINPFLNSTIQVIQTMAMTPVTAGPPGLKPDNLSFGDVSGILGLAGQGVCGAMVVSFEERAILPICSRMLYTEFTSVNEEIADAVGEMTNIISGGAKTDLARLDIKLDMATPITVLGKNVQIRQLSKRPVIQIPFETAEGKFVVEVSLYRT
ncbi:MAG: chemotaxis protein CheX [Deltaproteobacteria bacterium]|nr:chemotaxis protein CheX [Deltaproteobacteria bacterium]